MKNLTWLASYPKSGNTWTRMFLATYRCSGKPVSSLEDINAVTGSESLYSDFIEVSGRARSELTDYDIDSLRESVQTRLANSSRASLIFKTHNARVQHNGFPLIRRELTKAAIYVCRNPLDIVDSLADHVGCSHDEAIELTNDPTHRLGGHDSNLVIQHLDSWSTHADSWTSATEFPVLLVRYEDLKSAPVDCFREIVEFLGWEVDRNRLEESVKVTAFENLRKLEDRNGFAETSQDSKSGKFFRSGVAGAWPQRLTRQQADRVLNYHGEMMQKLGYEIPDLDQVFGKTNPV